MMDKFQGPSDVLATLITPVPVLSELPGFIVSPLIIVQAQYEL
jgi:hypothetical protein